MSKIILPESLILISRGCVSGCVSLKNINIPEKVEDIQKMQEYLGVKRSLKFKTSRKSLNTYIQNYIDSKKELQTNVLDYLSDQKESDNESYSILVQTINDQEITQKKADLLEFLHFLVNVSNNYHKNQSFFR